MGSSSQSRRRKAPLHHQWGRTQMSRVKWHIHASACRTTGTWAPNSPNPDAWAGPEVSVQDPAPEVEPPAKLRSYVSGHAEGKPKASPLMVPLTQQKPQYPCSIRVRCD